jgi:hypothetical protein
VQNFTAPSELNHLISLLQHRILANSKKINCKSSTRPRRQSALATSKEHHCLGLQKRLVRFTFVYRAFPIAVSSGWQFQKSRQDGRVLNPGLRSGTRFKDWGLSSRVLLVRSCPAPSRDAHLLGSRTRPHQPGALVWRYWQNRRETATRGPTVRAFPSTWSS